jgi:hypothetical protein
MSAHLNRHWSLGGSCSPWLFVCPQTHVAGRRRRPACAREPGHGAAPASARASTAGTRPSRGADAQKPAAPPVSPARRGSCGRSTLARGKLMAAALAATWPVVVAAPAYGPSSPAELPGAARPLDARRRGWPCPNIVDTDAGRGPGRHRRRRREPRPGGQRQHRTGGPAHHRTGELPAGVGLAGRGRAAVGALGGRGPRPGAARRRRFPGFRPRVPAKPGPPARPTPAAPPRGGAPGGSGPGLGRLPRECHKAPQRPEPGQGW